MSCSAADSRWAVKLDVRDLGSHVDVTRRARSGTLATGASKAISQVPFVGALPLGFLRFVGFVRTKFLPAGLHGSESAAVSGKSVDAFRTSIVRACWSQKLPMSNTRAVLSLLDAPERCEPAFYVIWREVSANEEVLRM